MIAVNYSDYEKYGCVNCGCDFCYSDHISGSTTPVICGECNTRFVIIDDDFHISTLGFSKKDYDGVVIKENNNGMYLTKADILKARNGIAIEKTNDKDFIYPVACSHPRKGILKHKFVRPDVRPEDGIGDFCIPRGVGYDLACFVKSKEAGKRITEMINEINKEYDNKEFSCHLDYRESEPLWIQVKIDYPSVEKAELLHNLIIENDNIITEEIVRNAINMKKPKAKEKKDS